MRGENGDSWESSPSFPQLQVAPDEAIMGDRPGGSTNKTKKDLDHRKVATTNLITQQVNEARDAGTLSNCSYKKNYDRALEVLLLLDSGFSVNKTTVIQRIQRDSLVTKRSGPKSPVAALE